MSNYSTAAIAPFLDTKVPGSNHRSILQAAKAEPNWPDPKVFQDLFKAYEDDCRVTMARLPVSKKTTKLQLARRNFLIEYTTALRIKPNVNVDSLEAVRVCIDHKTPFDRDNIHTWGLALKKHDLQAISKSISDIIPDKTPRTQRHDGSQQQIGRPQQQIGRPQQQIVLSQQQIGRSQQQIGRSQQQIGRPQQQIGLSQQQIGRPQMLSEHLHARPEEKHVDEVQARRREAFDPKGVLKMPGDYGTRVEDEEKWTKAFYVSSTVYRQIQSNLSSSRRDGHSDTMALARQYLLTEHINITCELAERANSPTSRSAASQRANIPTAWVQILAPIEGYLAKTRQPPKGLGLYSWYRDDQERRRLLEQVSSVLANIRS